MNKISKKWFIAAASLMLAGVIIFAGVMTVFKWDFKKLSTVKYETNSYTVTEEFKNISIKTQTADVEFLPSDGQNVSVVCYELQKVKHLVEVNNGTLEIKSNDTRKWFDHISFNFNSPKITVYIPEGEYEKLTVKNTTGDVKIPKGFAFLNADISVTTGDVFIEASVYNALRYNATTGDATLQNIKCNNVTATATTGDIKMKNVIAKDKITAKLTTGDIKLEKCDAAELFIKVTTGDVDCTLLSDKVFETKVTTGKVDVQESGKGGLCKVRATTGDIKIKIVS